MKTLHAAYHPVRSFSSISLTGAPIETSIYYIGDCYQVETKREDFEGDYCVDHEYFVRLSDAIAYAETV